MTMPKFMISLAAGTHGKWTLCDLRKAVEKISPKDVGSVSISELCTGLAATHPNGLYMFFDPTNDTDTWGSLGTLCYVGKSTARSFIERVPSHFDPREKSWFNTLTKRVLTRGLTTTYELAIARALGFNVVLLGIEDPTWSIPLEKKLRQYFQPTLNAAKGAIPADTPLCEL